MKLIYEALNTVEAHMILHLLEQAGLSARIDGEYLQGGVGEIQAAGVVRVMVEENDYADAREIINEWDKKQPDQEVQREVVKKNNSFSASIVGFLCGVASMAVYYNTPVTLDGVDYNGDGNLDEKWTYVNGLPSKLEFDRNLDGKTDFIYIYDRKGLLESSSSDDDFNGLFETNSAYHFGNAVWLKSDTTGDGFKDYKIDFEYGVVNTITFLNSVTKKRSKIQRYDSNKLKSGELDTNGDGVLDTLLEYDSIEEIANKFKK
ncbi:MAG: DUF2007 domain-containing protein [Pseudomonadales bacterium]|nr:DUF2007 domain-containing protein [Pseudomonadales bacterium]